MQIGYYERGGPPSYYPGGSPPGDGPPGDGAYRSHSNSPVEGPPRGGHHSGSTLMRVLYLVMVIYLLIMVHEKIVILM